MTEATRKARRSDALHYGGTSRRDLCDMIAHLEAENAKLRELTQQMFALIENHEETKYMDGELGRQIVNALYERMKELEIELDDFTDRMRELGVTVDD